MSTDFLHREYKNHTGWQNYLSMLHGYKWRFLWTWIMFGIKSIAVYVIPIIIAEVLNMLSGLTPDSDIKAFEHRLVMLLAIGAILVLQNLPTHIYYVRLMSVPCRDLEFKLRSALCTRFQHLSIPYHHSAHLGELQSKVTRDVEIVENMTRLLLENAPHAVYNIAIALIVTGIKAPWFLLFYLMTVPIAAVIFTMVRKRMQRNNHDFHSSVATMSGRVTEMLRLIPITRAHHLEDLEIRRVNQQLTDIRTSGLKMDFINSIFGAMGWIVFSILNVVTLIVLAFLYGRGKLDIGIGDIGLLAGYFGTITGNIMNLMGIFPFITKGMESVQSIGAILECPDIELNDKPAINDVRGDFEFQHVSFEYEQDKHSAVNDISLKVTAGETIAIVGQSGAGKSTLANLLIGFIRPTAGRILLDGKDMNDIDLRTYRQHISVVTQETLLFDATIRDNICYGMTPDENTLQNVVRDADLDAFIASLPEGLNTKIQENGVRLSGGQKQRIAIARALLRNPKVLILDEATSALDVETEADIKNALERLIYGRTTFIIAHRLSTIHNASRIVVMHNGRIAEIGTHAELIANNGIYADMNRKYAEATQI